ncbi:ABC transporter substrate-binding protein [Bacteroidetes bacterium SCGC AAA795-G10]|nr:ABC transporter substrate-binding protein [Bacteroidetes bacterium SCGC AAA795-G10]
MPKLLSNQYSVYLYLAIFFFLLSCNNTKNIENRTVFRYNEYRNVTSLDPAFSRNPQNIWPINQLFNGLVQLNKNLNIEPEIASSWSISPDGLTYTFYLRNDVYFHESPIFGEKKTRRVEAKDFVFSFDRLKDPVVASPGSWVLLNVENYEATAENILTITLKNPFPAFLGLLTMRYCSVVPKEVTNYYGVNFRSNPIGTGPFYFKRWDENVKLVLLKNQKYFEKDTNGNKLPFLDAISVRFIPDIQSEFMLFLQGKFDFINSLDASYKDELLDYDGTLRSKYFEKMNMLKGPYLNTEYIGIFLDSNNPAIKSKNIRRALNIGFDRKLMVAFLRNNIGYPAKRGIIPKGLPGTSDDEIKYDPKLAKRLVENYIKKTGERPSIKLATDSNYIDLCEYLQREFQKIGIEIKIDVMPTASLRQAKSSGKLELFRASWIADYPDAENYLSLFNSINFSPIGPNYTHYKNPNFDKMYKNSLVIMSDTLRFKKYREMDSLALSDFPIIPLYYDQVVRFVQKDVEGMEINPINLLVLKNVKKISRRN